MTPPPLVRQAPSLTRTRSPSPSLHRSVLLFSSTEPPERERKPDPNTYEPFRAVGEAVGKRLEAFMTEEGEPGERSQDHTCESACAFNASPRPGDIS